MPGWCYKIAMAMYQVSDLAGSGRRAFLDQAQVSSAALRDTDGVALVMASQARWDGLREIRVITENFVTMERVLQKAEQPAPLDLGAFAWLAEFDEEDRATAVEEIRDAIALALSADDLSVFRSAFDAVATTASAMRDPVRGGVLCIVPGDGDFVEVHALSE